MAQPAQRGAASSQHHRDLSPHTSQGITAYTGPLTPSDILDPAQQRFYTFAIDVAPVGLEILRLLHSISEEGGPATVAVPQGAFLSAYWNEGFTIPRIELGRRIVHPAPTSSATSTEPISRSPVCFTYIAAELFLRLSASTQITALRFPLYGVGARSTAEPSQNPQFTSFRASPPSC
jgi:hypothetical protein